jgi:hypothetical protein
VAIGLASAAVLGAAVPALPTAAEADLAGMVLGATTKSRSLRTR